MIGGVLGRHAEGVPAEGMQDVEAPHALRTGHHVADDVVANVSDVRVPGRVREHFKTVVLRLARDPRSARTRGHRPSASATWRRGPVVGSRPLIDYSPRHRGPWAARTAATARAPRPVSFSGAVDTVPVIARTVARSDAVSASRSYPPSVTIEQATVAVPRGRACQARHEIRVARFRHPHLCQRIALVCVKASRDEDQRGANSSSTGTTTRSNTTR